MTGPVARDPGLQPERTALAWTRTGLAVVAGSLLAGRLLSTGLGGRGLALGGLGVVLGLALMAAATARGRREAATRRRPGGALLAGVTAGCLVLGVAGVVVLAA